jgi:hypothetical protein
MENGQTKTDDLTYFSRIQNSCNRILNPSGSLEFARDVGQGTIVINLSRKKSMSQKKKRTRETENGRKKER